MTTLTQLWTTSPTWEVPPGWRQGRGAWGGLVVGQIITAAEQLGAGLPVRSEHVSILGPVMAGPVSVEVNPLRVGVATRAVEVTLRRGDEVDTRATVVFGADRAPTPLSSVPVQRTSPPPARTGDFLILGPPLAPEFCEQLRFAPVQGLPYGEVPDLVTTGWVSLPPDSDDPLTPAIIGALSDAWWTATLTGFGPGDAQAGPPPLATLDFMVTFPTPPGTADWSVGLWHEGRVIAGEGGYLTEERDLWTADGVLVAHNTQVVAVGKSR